MGLAFHRDTYCTADARRASRPAASDDRMGSSAAAASSMSHRCSGQERRLRAWNQFIHQTSACLTWRREP